MTNSGAKFTVGTIETELVRLWAEADATKRRALARRLVRRYRAEGWEVPAKLAAAARI